MQLLLTRSIRFVSPTDVAVAPPLFMRCRPGLLLYRGALKCCEFMENESTPNCAPRESVATAHDGGPHCFVLPPSSGCQCWEVKTDALMKRTRGRPLPSGRISLAAALGVGALASVAGPTLLFLGTNSVVAALGAGNILLYRLVVCLHVAAGQGPSGLPAGRPSLQRLCHPWCFACWVRRSLVYTPMKQVSRYNTEIGSVVGAIPPVMGYVAAAGGSTAATGIAAMLSPEAALMGALLFAWQMPHFHALSWYSRNDYTNGGHAMASVLDPTGTRTAQLMVNYSVGLTALPFAAAYLDVIDPLVCIGATPVNAWLLWQSAKFHGDRSNANATKAFRTTLWYLPVMMALFVAGRRKHTKPDEAERESVSPQAVVLPEVTDVDGAAASAGSSSSSSCSLKAIGHKDLCLHEKIRGMHVTPSCTEVVDATGEVVERVAEVVVKPPPVAQPGALN